MKKVAIQSITVAIIAITILFSSLKAQESVIAAVDFTAAAEKSIHSVVHIQCFYSVQTNTMMDFFDIFNFFNSSPIHPRQRSYQTSGSGVIMSENGYIITNNHVVEAADSIIVILNDRRTFTAKLIGNDPSADLAVIKIESSGLSAVSFGNSDRVRVGEWVLAVGNPFNLTSTVTHGIVSSKARNINILGNRMSQTPIESFIQTDAAVNPGNSGGALVNLHGELIGINTAIASSMGSFVGYSFAIPSNVVKKVTSDLIQYGKTQKAFLGISFSEIDASFAKSKNLKDIRGIFVENAFNDGAAFKAGVRDNDIITRINGKNVNTKGEFNEVMSQLSPGEQIEIEYERGSSIRTKTIVLLNSEGNTDVNSGNSETITAAGIRFRKVSDEERGRFGLEKGVGMVVLKVNNSSFGRVGIKEGLIITSIDKIPATDSVVSKLDSKKGKQIEIEGFYPNGQQVYFMMIL